MEATAAAGAGDSSFEPSLWDDFFVSYAPPCSQMSDEWMRERADELKREVHRMFEAENGLSVPDSLVLVDALQRLGIDNHFQKEIDTILSRVHSGELEMPSSEELHTVALRFRLLRQHGFFVSTDVFDKFRDGTGNFNTCPTRDPKGLLSLYNAAHMAVPGEDVLDDAIAFARTHLEAMNGNLASPIAEQICRSLDIPLTRYMPQLETMHFITEYEQEDGQNATLLELARLNYSLTRSVHLKELQTFCLWWKDFYKDVNLTYSRDRGVEIYFWSFGVFHGEGNTRARIILSKVIALISLMDDTFDDYATLEDCKYLDEAIQRWDESAASMLPEYLRMYYTKMLGCFNEFKDILEPKEKYRVPHVQKAVMLQSKYYLEEAKWCNEKYMPNFKDQIELSSMSSTIPVLILAALMAAGNEATKEVFEWASGIPDMVHACAEIGRLLNDIAAFKKGRKNKNDVASSLECYMEEHGTTGDEAAAALSAMVEHAWRRMNKAFMEIDRTLLPAVTSAVINQARINVLVYNGGKDAYTFNSNLEDVIMSVFLEPVPSQMMSN